MVADTLQVLAKQKACQLAFRRVVGGGVWKREQVKITNNR